MKVSTEGRQFIERHEGLRLCPYKVGSFERYWTIGYGHYGPDVKPGVCITYARAVELLEGDIEELFPALKSCLSVAKDVKQQEKDALLSFAFNLGSGVLTDTSLSTLARRFQSSEAKTFKGRKEIYADELPKWVKAGGQTLPGLVERRKDESRLASRGIYE